MTIQDLGRKHDSFALSGADRPILRQVAAQGRRIDAGTTLVHAGDRSAAVYLILAGWACRYQLLPDGGRQITGLLLPGDLADPGTSRGGALEHIMALTEAVIAAIPRVTISAWIEQQPSLARALWRLMQSEQAIARQWQTSLGRRDAYERVAHLFCELCARLDLLGLAANNRLILPLTQSELADVLGLTQVHVNRVLQRLRSEQLIQLQKQELIILDIERLQQVAGFDPAYLQCA